MTLSKRGRPLCAATIEKQRIEDLLTNPPSHIRPMTKEERREMDSMLDSFDKAEKEILREYRTSVTIPKSHAYEMASLGDESLNGFESEILARDKQYLINAERSRTKGGQGRGNELKFRARRLAEINQDLIKKVESGEISVGEVARRIHSRWLKRGVPGTSRPSQKTLERHIKRVVPEK